MDLGGSAADPRLDKIPMLSVITLKFLTLNSNIFFFCTSVCWPINLWLPHIIYDKIIVVQILRHAQCLKTRKNHQVGLKYHYIEFEAEIRSNSDCKPPQNA